MNPQLLLDGRSIGCPDVYLPGLGLGGEVDSRERHENDDDDVESTYDRHERITTHGIQLVHLSVRRIRRDVTEAARHLMSYVPSGGDWPSPSHGAWSSYRADRCCVDQRREE